MQENFTVHQQNENLKTGGGGGGGSIKLLLFRGFGFAADFYMTMK